MPTKCVAYLISQYPAPSHTFIRREVSALRIRGLSIRTYGIHPPLKESRLSPEDESEKATTWFLRPVRPLSLLKSHLTGILTRLPGYLCTLGAAFRLKAPGIKNLVWAWFYFLEAIWVAETMRKDGVVHIHNHFANSSSNVGYLASRYLKTTWSLTLHGSADWVYPWGYLLPKKLDKAEFVACVSYYGMSQAYCITAPEKWQKFFVNRCGIETKFLTDGPKKEQAADSDILRFLSVGRLAPEKGQAGLLEAFSLALKNGVRARLTIIGTGPERERLENRIVELGLSDAVNLAGQKPVSAVFDALADTDLFILSSFMEGLPVVLMEALGMNVPIIAPCVAGIPELVRHNETGLLFSSGHWTELSEAIVRLSGDPKLRKTLAERGRRLVREEFDINAAVEPIYNRFSRILK